MKHPLQDLPTDDTGARILGNPNQGCRHCGQVEVHYSTNGKIAWYHPGTRCCKKAVEQELTWRQNDINQLTQTHNQKINNLNENKRKLTHLTGREATELKQEIAKQEAGTKAHEQKVRQRIYGIDKNDIGLQDEIKELQTILNNWPT